MPHLACICLIWLVYTFFHVICGCRVSFKLINKYNWEVVRQVLTIALLQSQFKKHLVIMLSMAVCLVNLVGLFIVGIILNSNFKFTELWNF